MRGRVMAFVLTVLTLAGPVPARALDEISLVYGNYWRVAFSSVEIEKTSAFLSGGAKLGVTNPTQDVSFFIASSQGYSLSDGERAFRFGWPADRMESQSRLMFGLERSAGALFVSVAAGPSQARLQARRQPDPFLQLIQIARRFDIDPRFIPALVGSVPPAAIRGLLPPRMETATGGVLDVNIWWRPRADAYVHWALLGDSAAQSLWTRLRLGQSLRPLPFAIGPEAATAVGRNWHKYRLGLHIGDIKLWRFGFEAAGGWVFDETRRWGAYASFALHSRF